MATLEVNGVSLDYVEKGQGDPLLLVHGSASDRRTWRHQLAPFGERFRVVAYSRRHHWPNDPISEGADYSMAEHVDDLEAVVGALDAGPVHVVGHSYGAFLGLLLSIRSPSLVRSLVLGEPPVLTLVTSDPPKPGELFKLLLTSPRTAVSIVRFGASAVAPATAEARKGRAEEAMLRFGRYVLGREAFEALSEERLEQVRANSMAAEFLGSGFAPLDPDQVRRVRTPTLLVTGSRSPGFFHRLADRLEALLPDCERAEIAGASHISHEDEPGAYNRAVLSFLEERREVA